MGYSRKGTRAVNPRPGPRGSRHSLLLCISPAGVCRYSLHSKGVRSEDFRQFLLSLPADTTVVLDNASIHHATKSLQKKGLTSIPEVAKSRNQVLQYLPAYSPQLNLTELCFNVLRRRVEHAMPRTVQQLEEVIQRSLSSLRTQGFFDQCWGKRKTHIRLQYSSSS